MKDSGKTLDTGFIHRPLLFAACTILGVIY